MIGLTILHFIRTNWKVVTITGLIIILVTGAYLKGRRDVAIQQTKETVKELENIHNNVERERAKTEVVRNRIRTNRDSHPKNDKRDSCILSNDPYEVDCLK
jgi:predicted tellurium resistance membrane protein TerC